MDSCNSYLIDNLTLLKKEGLVNQNYYVQMNFADNWARVFVVITFLTFGEAQIIGISVTIGLNAIVFIWYFFFSGLT